MLDRGKAHGGPLEGIRAGLVEARQRAPRACLLVAACDMPLLTPAVYSRLLLRCMNGADFVGLRSPTGPEPLCSAWSSPLLPVVEAALRAGEARPVEALARAQRVEWLEPGETDQAQIMNINTPEDFERLKQGGAP